MEGHARSFTRWRILRNWMVTKTLRYCDQEGRQTDGSRHWDNVKPTLVRAFVREGARDFDVDYWLVLIHEGSNNMGMEYCKDSNGSLSYLRAIQGHANGITISSVLMNYTLYSFQLERHIYHRRISWNFQSILESGKILGGEENDRARRPHQRSR